MTGPADTAAILDQLGRLLRQLTRMTGGADDGRAMTATQRIALIEIGDAGPLRLNDLASRMGTSAPTASRAVDVLGELGLVARAPDAEDRRAVRIELTPAGRELVDERKTRAGAAFDPAVAAHPAADPEKLFKQLARMNEALS
ncbi:MAG: MarR family winged helix-turn-helix transcriptional regulator, partial [Solirubrobacteraceae bacterium]